MWIPIFQQAAREADNYPPGYNTRHKSLSCLSSEVCHYCVHAEVVRIGKSTMFPKMYEFSTCQAWSAPTKIYYWKLICNIFPARAFAIYAGATAIKTASRSFTISTFCNGPRNEISACSPTRYTCCEIVRAPPLPFAVNASGCQIMSAWNLWHKISDLSIS